MGTLTYVRHGQARPFEKDSDQLSAAGEAQARALGEHWARRGVTFDEVYSGTLVRQVRTAEIVGQCLTTAGLPWPQPQAMPEFNEYDANGITGTLIPALAERDEEYRALFAAYEANRHAPDRNRHFQKMFEAVTTCWLNGDVE
ncbi:MAG TPA: phosphoglycerate mutase family protein, partial [Blastocatellia bacterium]|nr:phosphoglycerate mutase family protein [Blastocatellia bacterium]